MRIVHLARSAGFPPSPKSRAVPSPHRGKEAPPQPNLNAAFACITILGIILRLLRYAHARSLWLDEIFLANNLIHKSFLQLLGPLDYRQGAPPLFLLLCKLAITIFGTSEYALRLVPLLAGIAGMILFALLVRNIFSTIPALAALALFALLEPLVYYSSEVKQYSTDVLVAIAIFHAVTKLVAASDPPRPRRWVVLFVTGLVGIFLSHPAIFILAGVSLWLLTLRKYRIGQLSFLFLGWLIAAGFDYFLFLKPLELNAGLQHHWAAAYPPLSRAVFPWLWNACKTIFTGYDTMWLRFAMFGSWPAYAAMILAAIGGANLYRRRILGLVAWPIFITLAAASFHKYPFDDRLILFLVPSVVLLIGAALQGRAFAVGAFMFAFVLVSCLGREFVFAVEPPGREEIQPVIAYLKNHWQPGDTLYIYRPADTAYLYYRNQMGFRDLPFIHGQWQSGDSDNDLHQLAGRPRVWILFSHILPTPHGNERAEFQQMFQRGGAIQIEKFEAPGAGVYLYRMSPR